MATLSVIAINNKAVTSFAKQFNYDQVVFGPVAYVPANNSPSFATGLAMFTYDEGLGRPTKYIVSDSLATTRAYFLAAGSLLTTATPTSTDVPSMGVGTYTTPVTETAVVENANIVSHIATATNKTVAGKGSIAGLFMADTTADAVHVSLEGVRSVANVGGNVYEAYGVLGELVISGAVAAHDSLNILTGLRAKTTISAAVTQGWVSSGRFSLLGASAVTERCNVIVAAAEASVTALTSMLYVSNLANVAKGVEFVGSYTQAIDFSGITPAYAAYTTAGTGSRNRAFIGIGTWDAPMSITNASDHFVPIQVNIKNDGNVAFDVAAARFRVDTNGATALASHNVLELRAKVAHNVAASAVVQASADYSAAVSITTGEVAIGYFSLDGVGAITLPGSNCASALIGSVTNTGTFVGTANIAYLRTAASTAITNGILMSNLGTMTNAINLTTDAAVTNLINIGAVTNVTNLIKFNAVAGCLVAKDVVPGTVSSNTSLGADHALKVLVGSTAYYIPLFATLHA